MEDRPGRRVNMMTARLTGIGAALAHGVKGGALLTTGANNIGPAIVDFHQLGETGGVVRIFLLELLERVFCHRLIPFAACYLRLRGRIRMMLLVVKG